MHPFLSRLPRAFAFAGRARRGELWPFAALCAVLLAVAAAWDAQGGRSGAIGGVAGPATVAAALLLAVPLAALTVRRLHDGGRPAASLALALVPLIGPALLLAWLAEPGQRGANRFGIDPKGRERHPAPAAASPFGRA